MVDVERVGVVGVGAGRLTVGARKTEAEIQPTVLRYNDLERHAERISSLAEEAPSPKREWAARLSTNSDGRVWATEKGSSARDLRSTSPSSRWLSTSCSALIREEVG